MSWRIPGLIAILVLTLRGIHMAHSPATYVGPGWLDARDTRTVRRFGVAHALTGALVFALFLSQFVQE